jgi:hypothetical protein
MNPSTDIAAPYNSDAMVRSFHLVRLTVETVGRRKAHRSPSVAGSAAIRRP